MSTFHKTCISVFGFDMMEEAIKGASFEHMQLQGGVFSGELLRLELPGLCIDYGNYNLSVSARGGISEGAYTVGMLLRSHAKDRFFKKETSMGTLLFMPPGCELEVTLGGQPNWCTLSFDKEIFENTCLALFGENPFDKKARQALVVASCPETIRLLKSIRHIMLSIEQLTFEHEAYIASQQMSEDLLNKCLEVLYAKNYGSPLDKISNRAKLVESVEDFLNETKPEIVRVADLATAMKVSVRTIEYAFMDVFGVTPKSYLMIRKLNHVRQQLIRKPEKTISYHASQAGFWHMADFASRYKSLFGETPSDTIKKTRKRQ